MRERRENAILVSDDIFFQRFASISEIDNTSFPLFYTKKNVQKATFAMNMLEYNNLLRYRVKIS